MDIIIAVPYRERFVDFSLPLLYSRPLLFSQEYIRLNFIYSLFYQFVIYSSCLVCLHVWLVVLGLYRDLDLEILRKREKIRDLVNNIIEEKPDEYVANIDLDE